MKTKILTKKARRWGEELKDRMQPDDSGEETAVVAWQVVGGLAVLLALFLFVREIPSMIRELRIMRM